MNGQKSFKSIARRRNSASKRGGFWQDARREMDGNDGKGAGKRGQRKPRLSLLCGQGDLHIRGGDDDAFYGRVRAMLLSEGEVSDALARLTDREVFDKLSYEEKQRYMLNLSERYLKALERFRRECEFEGRG